jgi:Zn-dependent peptidase ImmA (M78 family)
MTTEQEEEANYFAMHLLIPEHLLAQDLARPIDLADDKAIRTLAKRYQVPLSVMVMRLIERKSS